MSDGKAAPHSVQYKSRMSGGSSVQMEDRNMLRRMEKERRSQGVQQEEMQYDRIAPLFSKPYKRIKDDELSSLIQRMLGNYEDGYDGPEELCPALPYDRSSHFPHVDEQSVQKHRSRDAPDCVSVSGPPSGESWDSLPALSPPVEPLSPLQSSESDGGPSPERSSSSRRPDAPPLTHALPLNLHGKLANAKKPTAYVRPTVGQDQVTSDSPELKASPESYEHLQDLKDSSKPKLPALQSSDIVSGVRVEDILQEMTSWPPLLTTICTPTTAEPTKFSSTNEETCGFQTLKADESSDRVQLESQGVSSSSSDTDSSSETDSEKSSSPDEPAAPETLHTQPQKESDWQLRRWLESRDHQQNHKSPCDVIRPISQDSSERTGSQSCHSDPTNGGKASDHRQTVGSKNRCEDPLLESTGVEISQRAENTSTHSVKHKRKKTVHHTEQKKKTTDNNISKQTDRKQTHQPLLVKIELNLLSRIPQGPKSAPSHAESNSASGRKRAVKRDEKSSKKQKLDKEGKHSSSTQQSLHQSEYTMMKKKKSVKHSSGLPQESHKDSGREHRSAAAPDGQQKKAETQGKKTCKSRKELPEKPCPRALLPPDRRKLSVEDHLKEAKKLKHKADATPDKMAKALRYLEAALSFVESGVAMETEPQTPKSAYTMFSETVDLIRFILKLKNYTDPSAAAHERDFCILCMRCQSLLQMAMFRSRRDSALKYSRTLTDHFKVCDRQCCAGYSHTDSDSLTSASWSFVCFQSLSWSASPSVSKSAVSSLGNPQPIQQVAAAYVSITALFLSAHETWEQADEIALRGSGLLRELDSAVGPLSLTSSTSALVQYTRHGLHWIRLDTQNPR
ncbi:AF4/FMR2 family member 3-like isoform X2 [Cyprinus carpio]|uniref:AF4/FMR2 family member 3-like isoform X2 n=1 Tax=Cyprinus carpio TaxID=7962 RepID=A0A9Q9Z992_CYPCA|nr:AF4/FMR2 family member 3-like isoform X2 [Cyprinus carpio]